MANPPTTKETRPRSEPHTKQTPTEWPDNPPLPPPELDPSGEAETLRAHAHPGDDTVFAANADEGDENEARAAAPEPELAGKKDRKEIGTEDDAQHSRIER